MSGAPVLSFREVSVAGAPPYETPLSDCTFDLAAGDLALVDMGDAYVACPLADAAEGLVDLDSGTVTFLGDDWQALSVARAAAHRASIGRVFEKRSWISNLDVDENVTLARRHHTGQRHAGVMAEASRIARDLGLGEIPQARPAFVGRHDLRLAQWVRAFLGAPRLIILEDPLRGVARDLLDNLLAAVGAAREEGAAVLWLAAGAREREVVGPHATARLVRKESTFVFSGEVA